MSDHEGPGQNRQSMTKHSIPLTLVTTKEEQFNASITETIVSFRKSGTCHLSAFGTERPGHGVKVTGDLQGDSSIVGAIYLLVVILFSFSQKS